MEIIVILCYYVFVETQMRRSKMADYKIYEVSAGAQVIAVPAERFKTNEISISFITPLSAETAAENAVVPFILSRTCAEYPSILELNRKLASLYGAQIEPAVIKTGEVQQLKIGMTCLDDRFSLDGGKITAECVNLLLSLAFDPSLDEDGAFLDENVQREKRVLIEKIESEENEKRIYALHRAEEIMFNGEPYAVNRYGTRQSVARITPQSAAEAWKKLLETSKIVITAVGSANAAEIAEMLAQKLAGMQRKYLPLPKAEINSNADSVKRVTEKQKVRQGKLVMGFKVECDPDNKENAAAMRSFCDIFGGGPYSKLFANVREKMSLCYYCSARFTRQKSFMMVQSGCEEENMQKAESEIMNQLEEIRKGNFDYEFSSSKAALTDALDSVYDSPESIEAWYGVLSAESSYTSPQESAKLNNAVTKQQIIECANSVTLDTVYKLVCEKEEEE